MKIICAITLFFFAVVSSSNADVVRVFKRTSDGLIKTMTIQGQGTPARTENEDFELLFGSLEPYELAIGGDIPGDIKEIDILPNGTVKYTEFTQAEKDAHPANVAAAAKKAKKNSAKGKLKALGLTQDEIDAIIG